MKGTIPVLRAGSARGGLIAPRARGAVLRDARSAARAPFRTAPPRTVPGTVPRTALWRVAVLVIVLPLFAQSFQYLIDIPALYYLSKGWPVLVMPLAAWALVRLDVPYKPLLVVSCAWMFGVTPFIGILVLGNTIPDALATTAKVWSFTFPLSGAAMLVLLRPRPETLRRAMCGIGVFTYAITPVIYAIAPTWMYLRPNTETKFFIWDLDRGFHLYVPMFFGMMLVLYLNRSFWIRPRLWKPAVVLGCYVIMLLFIKERLEIVGTAAVIVLACVRRLGRWRNAGYVGLAVLGCVGAVLAYQHVQGSAVKESLGGSLSTRQETVMTTLNYLGADPLRWILGVGATSRVGSVTLIGIFQNRAFYLADIGWLGVVFEYGVIGATLIALIHFAGLRYCVARARADDPLSLALGDYILYVLLTSVVYSVVYVPGELTTCMALAWYLDHVRRSAPEAPPRTPVRPPAGGRVAPGLILYGSRYRAPS